MKILLIDNHSKHFKEILKLFPENLDVISQEEIEKNDVSKYDLIVLSGGSKIEPVMYHPEKYEQEIELVRNCEIPILGICLGCEIITYAYGGTLKEFSEINRGEIELEINDGTLSEILMSKNITVYEGHKFGIDKMPENFDISATSEHGPEIIIHKSKPVIGVQFHPEVGPNKILIEWLLGKLIK